MDMARPPKDKRLLKNVYLRVPLTAEQKEMIDQAALLDQSETAPWVRSLMVRAAAERLAAEKTNRSARK